MSESKLARIVPLLVAQAKRRIGTGPEISISTARIGVARNDKLNGRRTANGAEIKRFTIGSVKADRIRKDSRVRQCTSVVGCDCRIVFWQRRKR
jgi:hypothetical protein